MRREAKKQKVLFVCIAVAVVLSVFSIWLVGELRIDSCLDRGGQWDYEQRKCDGARSA
jgi:hypothetical protein